MRQRHVTAFVIAAGILLFTGDLSAQVSVQLTTPNWNYQYACPPGWSGAASITITELNDDDFFGSPGASTYFDLLIALPAGWEFNPNTSSPAEWDVPTSANLQKSSGTIIFRWSDVDDTLRQQYSTEIGNLYTSTPPRAGAVNTIVIKGLECKNTQKGDVITLSNIEVNIFPGTGDVPQGQLYMWTTSESGDLPTTRPLVRNIPTVGYTSTSPEIEYNPGPAEGLVFLTEPASSVTTPLTYHDVQERIKGATWTSGNPTWPLISAVDCNGYKTTVGLTGKPVVLTLLDAAGNAIGTTFWDGLGATYDGSTASTTSYPTWQSTGDLPLIMSVPLPGDFRVKAKAADLVPGTYAQSIGIANEDVSAVFGARQRPVEWNKEPAIPDSWDFDIDGLDMPVFSVAGSTTHPKVQVKDLYGASSSGDALTFDIQLGGPPALTPPSPLDAGRYHATVSSSTGISEYVDAHILFDRSEGSKPLIFSAYAYVYTQYFNQAPTSVKYLDPRYTYPAGYELSITPLPVELVAFGGQMRNDVVTLKWTTATETNNYGFDVERSFDRASWSKVGFVQGNGTTSSQHDYRFEDRLGAADLQNAAISYRLRQIDRDGTTEYSQVVTLSVAPTAEKVTMLQNYPNPFNPTTNISFYLPTSDVVTLVVYNELGVEVARVRDNAALDSGWHTTSFRAGSLPSGLYAYRLQTGTGSVARTMVVAK